MGKIIDKCELLTIGYEGKNIEEFISRLKGFNVTRIIDVRELPLSRKKGFSKFALKERLEQEDIQYVHLKALGSPSVIRKKLKMDWDYEYFFRAYSKYLSGNLDAIKKLFQYITDGINCIMCFEQVHEKCHRHTVANKIQEYYGNGLKISHI